MRAIAGFFLLSFAGAAHAAAPAEYVGDANCRIAPVEPRSASHSIRWTGPCVGGFAEGRGILSWSIPNCPAVTVEATLVRGEVVGEAVFRSEGYTYIGPLKHGQQHGRGYSESKAKGMYQGGFAAGNPDGSGIRIAVDGSRYEGQWKDGLKHGFGREVFALGGNYEGEYKDGRFHGKGAVTYAGSGIRYEGQFIEGRAAGAAAVETDTPVPARSDEADPAPQAASKKLGMRDIPREASWAELTPAQRDVLKRFYGALEYGDEPPYPAKGLRPMINFAHSLQDRFPWQGRSFSMHVLVGADGQAKSARGIGLPDSKIVRNIASFAMNQQYKPAICRGQPCEMIYAFAFAFE